MLEPFLAPFLTKVTSHVTSLGYTTLEQAVCHTVFFSESVEVSSADTVGVMTKMYKSINITVYILNIDIICSY